jgi:hypothetical protein
VTSGRIITCDKDWIYSHEPKPLAETIAPGRYPVALCLSHIVYSSGEKGRIIIQAALIIDDTLPAYWKYTGSYEIYSGTGCYADADILYHLADDETDRSYFSHGKVWTNTCIDAVTGLNIMTFWLDHANVNAECYFGYNQAGHIVGLMTDFHVFLRE